MEESPVNFPLLAFYRSLEPQLGDRSLLGILWPWTTSPTFTLWFWWKDTYRANISKASIYSYSSNDSFAVFLITKVLQKCGAKHLLEVLLLFSSFPSMFQESQYPSKVRFWVEDRFGELLPRALSKYLTMVNSKLFSLHLLSAQGDIGMNPPGRVQSWLLKAGRGVGRRRPSPSKRLKTPAAQEQMGQETTASGPWVVLRACVSPLARKVVRIGGQIGQVTVRHLKVFGRKKLWHINQSPFWFHDDLCKPLSFLLHPMRSLFIFCKGLITRLLCHPGEQHTSNYRLSTCPMRAPCEGLRVQPESDRPSKLGWVT